MLRECWICALLFSISAASQQPAAAHAALVARLDLVQQPDQGARVGARDLRLGLAAPGERHRGHGGHKHNGCPATHPH